MAEIDHELERKYDNLYPLHPARPEHGSTTNPLQDGLFSVGTAFTPGYGSEHGRGYIVRIQMATLSQVPETTRQDIEEDVVRMIEERLPAAFPGKDLRVERDGHVYKICGDLSLGEV